MAHASRITRRSAALALLIVLAAVGAALAAGQFKPNAVYTGKDSACGSSVKGTTCRFKFHANASGASLAFVGKTVIDTWGCHGGGGEALLGGTKKGADPLPALKASARGKVTGRAGSGQHEVTATGHVSNAGKTVKVVFHNQGCATESVTLTAG